MDETRTPDAAGYPRSDSPARDNHHEDQQEKPNPIYTPLDPEKDEIRLIYINPASCCDKEIVCCSLYTVSMDFEPEYAALSYVWGDPDDVQDICLNGQTVQVTKNLAFALRRLRGMPQEHFWADAICINQQDLDERSQQVRLMQDIYTDAVMVYAFLSGNDGWINAGLTWVGTLSDMLVKYASEEEDLEAWIKTLPSHGKKIGDIVDRGLRSILRLMHNIYWDRVWIFQEVVLAEQVTFLSADNSLEMEKFIRVCQFLTKVGDGAVAQPKFMDYYKWCDLKDLIVITPMRPLDIDRCRKMVEKIDRDKPMGQLTRPREDIFFMTRRLLATDPHDTIYGVLGVLDVKFKVDYTCTIKDLYYKWARFLAIKHRSLMFLCQSGIGLNPPDEKALPSWIPDWSASKSGYNTTNIKANKGLESLIKGVEYIHQIVRNTHLVAEGVVLGTVSAEGVTNMNADSQAANNWGKLYKGLLARDDYPTKQPALQIVFHLLTQDESPIAKKGELLVDSPDVVANVMYFVKLLMVEGDRTASYFPHPDTEADVLNAVIRDFWGIRDFKITQKDVSMLGTPRFYFRRETNLGTERQNTLKEAYRLYAKGNVSIHVFLKWSTWLLHTSSGFIGCSGPAVQPGDVVVILVSCVHPLVFRMVDSHWIIIEPCFVHGAMYGEAEERVKSGLLSFQTFEIH